MAKEIWKDIPEHPKYQISSLGRIKSITRIIPCFQYKRVKTEKILKPYLSNTGYKVISLDNKRFYIHRLVAQAFLPNPENKPEIDHIDTNRTNNSISNLRWVTRSENNRNPISLEKYKIGRTGIKDTAETKLKKSLSAFKYAVKCVETGKTYTSCKEAYRKTGINPFSISRVCRGIRRTAGKLHWSFV